MKKIILLIAALVALISTIDAQIVLTRDGLVARQWIEIDSVKFYGISTDSTLTDATDTTGVSSLAVKEYVDNKFFVEVVDTTSSLLTQAVSANTPELLVNLDSIGSNGIVFANDSITITGTGLRYYNATLSLEWSNGTNTTTNTIHIYVNGTPVESVSQLIIDNGVLYVPRTIDRILQLQPGDIVELYVEADAGSNVQIESLIFTLKNL